MTKQLACRCEDVTLAELTHAISLGHRDLESLKRYTGFATGWCQGRGCLTLCAQVLASHGGAVSQPTTPRPPVCPTALGDLAQLDPDLL